MLLITKKIKYSYIIFLKSINHIRLLCLIKYVVSLTFSKKIYIYPKNFFFFEGKNPKNSRKKKIICLILNSIYEIHHADCTRLMYERSYHIRSSSTVSLLIFGGLCTFMRPTYCKRTHHETIFS